MHCVRKVFHHQIQGVLMVLVRVVGSRQYLADFDLPVDVALVLHDLFDRDDAPARHATAKDRAESSLPKLFSRANGWHGTSKISHNSIAVFGVGPIIAPAIPDRRSIHDRHD